MGEREISRRAVVGALGAGAAAVSAGVASPVGHRAAETTPEATLVAPSSTAELLRPLGPGSKLGRWTLEELRDVSDGAAALVLRDRAGALFQLDVCARDTTAGAERGPASTEHFEVFLANTGDGSTATHEDHGLAAMALAEVIRGNEQRVGRAEFLTLAQRIATRDVRRHLG